MKFRLVNWLGCLVIISLFFNSGAFCTQKEKVGFDDLLVEVEALRLENEVLLKGKSDLEKKLREKDNLIDNLMLNNSSLQEQKECLDFRIDDFNDKKIQLFAKIGFLEKFNNELCIANGLLKDNLGDKNKRLTNEIFKLLVRGVDMDLKVCFLENSNEVLLNSNDNLLLKVDKLELEVKKSRLFENKLREGDVKWSLRSGCCM